MLARNLPYTGVTRGKRLVVVGQENTPALAVRDGSARRRWSKLREWLRPDTPTGPPAPSRRAKRSSPDAPRLTERL